MQSIQDMAGVCLPAMEFSSSFLTREGEDSNSSPGSDVVTCAFTVMVIKTGDVE